MKKIKYLLVAMVFFMLTTSICIFNPSTSNNAMAEEPINQTIDNSVSLETNGLTIDQLSAKYVNRDNTWTSADKLPEFYSMVEGNGTSKYKTGISEQYDTYMLYVQDQDEYPICWSFPSTMAMQTTIAKQTGEIIDFSEQWASLAHTAATAKNPKKELADLKNYYLAISQGSPYVTGGGGNFLMYDLLARNQGVVLESEFNMHQGYLVAQDETNYESNSVYLYDYYSQYAQNYLENYVSVFFNYKPSFDETDSKTRESQINSVKKHILKHGSISIGMYIGILETQGFITISRPGNEMTAGVTKYYDTVNLKIPNTHAQGMDNGRHAVTLIGWDDTYVNKNNQKGAWIALNSWGSADANGIMYIEYLDKDIDTQLFGYLYDENLYKTKGYASNKGDLKYTDTIKESNASGAKTPAGLKTDQKNIFYQPAFVNIKYGYTLSEGAQIDNVSLFYQDNDITRDYPIQLNTTTKTITVTMRNNLKAGLYKVAISYSDADEQKVHYNLFNVTNGLEFGKIETKVSSSKSIKSLKQQIYNTQSVGDFQLTVPTYTDTGKVEISLYKNNWSKINKVLYVDSGNFDVEQSFTTHSTSIYFSYNLNAGQKTKYTLTVQDESGKFKRDINLIVFKIDSTTQQLTYMDYDLDGGYLTDSLLDKMPININGQTKIDIPTKRGYGFRGWYLDKNFTKPITTNAGNYYLELANFILTGDYRHNNSNLNMASECYTLNLYAKWEKTHFFISYESNGGNSISAQEVIAGTYVQKPEDPTKVGYNFVAWHKDEECKEPFNFSTEKMPNYDMVLYASWKLKNIESASLSIPSGEWQEKDTNYKIKLDFLHDFKNKNGTSIKVKWLKNGSLWAENTSLEMADIHQVTEPTIFTYSAVITLTYLGEETEEYTTSNINVYAVPPVPNISAISYEGEGQYTWVDTQNTANYFGTLYHAQYKITLYKQGLTRPSVIYETTISSQEFNNNSIKLFDKVIASGQYHIGIVKSFGQMSTKEIISENNEIVSVSYMCDTTDCETPKKSYFDINTSIAKPNDLIKVGYTFDGWYLTESFDGEIVNFPLTISNVGDTIIYAKWKLNDFIDCKVEGENVEGITYDLNNHTVIIATTHELNTLNYQYEWFKNEESVKTTTENTFSVSNVAESGNYSCIVTATDNKNRQVSASASFIVDIQRANTVILTNNVVTNFVYNASERVIDSGAEIEGFKSRNKEDQVELVYSNNKFKDVPEEGFIEVVINAPESANFLSQQTTVKVYIDKATSTLEIENQDFTYNGQPVIPVGEITNDEQLLKFEGEEIINVGTYTRKVIAYGSPNYYDLEDEITITVKPAIIQVKAKNITSLWLFGKQKLEYEVVKGEQFGGDNLGIKLISDVKTTSPGKYTISISADNSNYHFGTIEGIYTVTIVPHIIILLTILLVAAYIIILHFMKNFSIEFEGTGGKIYAPIETKSKKNIRLKTPEREGYAFEGWYMDEDLTIPYNGEIKRGKLLTLYAKWSEVANPEVEQQVKDNDMVRDFVNSLFNNNKPQPEPVQTIVEPQPAIVEPQPAIVEEENKVQENTINMDFINSIINKASTTNSTPTNNVANIKEFIDKISKQ